MKLGAFVVWIACMLAMTLAGHSAAAGTGDAQGGRSAKAAVAASTTPPAAAQRAPAAEATSTPPNVRDLARNATYDAYHSARATRQAWTSLWVFLGLALALLCGMFVASYDLRLFGNPARPKAAAVAGRRYALIAAAVAFAGLVLVTEASLAKLDADLSREKAVLLQRLATDGDDSPPVGHDS